MKISAGTSWLKECWTHVLEVEGEVNSMVLAQLKEIWETSRSFVRGALKSLFFGMESRTLALSESARLRLNALSRQRDQP